MQIFPTVVFEGGNLITIDDIDSVTNSTSGSTVNYGSFVINQGDNRILIVAASAFKHSGTGETLISGITWGGTALSKVISETYAFSKGELGFGVWYLLDPAITSGDIIVTYSGGLDSSVVLSGVLSNAAQQINVASNLESYTTSASINTNITTTTVDGFVLNIFAGGENKIYTPGNRQTELANIVSTNITMGWGQNTETVVGTYEFNWGIDKAIDTAHLVTEWKHV